jgi:hypothetical protein
VRTHLSIRYEVSKQNPADVHDEFTKAEECIESVMTQARHLMALFTLFTFVDAAHSANVGDANHKLDELCISLNYLGELGAALSDNLYSTVQELDELQANESE